MHSALDVALLNPPQESWPAEVRTLRQFLGAPQNPLLFPPHYLGATFHRSGGHIVLCRTRGELSGAGFLFPRGIRNGRREFTLRFHNVPGTEPVCQGGLMDGVCSLFPDDGLFYYDPCAAHSYCETSEEVDGIEVGRPGEREAAAIRFLQRAIWGSHDDFLYPADIHSQEFKAGTSLVARVAGRPVGFLLGLYKYGGSPLPDGLHERVRTDLRVESQMIGVLPEFRGRGIALALKKAQAEATCGQGIDVINWTADPLQYGNALLNFGKLGAVACDFHRDYYSFRNDLNHLPASRLGISWLPGHRRARQGMTAPSGSNMLPVGGVKDGSVAVVNRGWSEVVLDACSPAIAIEVPAHWTALQRQDLPRALSWREATDIILERYIGCCEGRYIVTGIGEDGENRYLIAERVSAELRERLAA